MGDVPKGRWSGFIVRTVALLLAGFLLAYFSSYDYLSRRGMREAQAQGADGFLYVSWDEAAATHDLSRHHRLAEFYAPVNFVDRSLFGGDWPMAGILWDLQP